MRLDLWHALIFLAGVAAGMWTMWCIRTRPEETEENPKYIRCNLCVNCCYTDNCAGCVNGGDCENCGEVE